MKMRVLISMFVFMLIFISGEQDVAAANRTCTCAGGAGPCNMSLAGSWNVAPVAADNLLIRSNCVVDNAFNNLGYGTLAVSPNGANPGILSWPANPTKSLTVNTVITGGAGVGTISMTNGGTLQITTGWTSTNTTLIPGTGKIIWNVTGANSTFPTTPATGVNQFYDLTISATGGVASLGLATTINNNLLISAGTLSVSASNFALTVKRDFTNNATFTPGTGANVFTMGGTTAQNISGATATTFNNLTIDNSSTGVTLAGNTNTTISRQLALTNGTIITNANTLITTPACNNATVPVTRTNGWVVGNLQKAFPTATAFTCTFEVGSINYEPVNIIFATATTSAGNMTLSAMGTSHPWIASSGVNWKKAVNRYWTITNGSTPAGSAPLVGLPAAGFNAIFNFVAADYLSVPVATPTNFIVKRYTIGAINNDRWFTTISNGACTATQCPIKNLVNATLGNFAIGEPVAKTYTYKSGPVIYLREIY